MRNHERGGLILCLMLLAIGAGVLVYGQLFPAPSHAQALRSGPVIGDGRDETTCADLYALNVKLGGASEPPRGFGEALPESGVLPELRPLHHRLCE